MNRMSGETAPGWRIIALVASLAVLFVGEVLGRRLGALVPARSCSLAIVLVSLCGGTAAWGAMALALAAVQRFVHGLYSVGSRTRMHGHRPLAPMTTNWSSASHPADGARRLWSPRSGFSLKDTRT